MQLIKKNQLCDKITKQLTKSWYKNIIKTAKPGKKYSQPITSTQQSQFNDLSFLPNNKYDNNNQLFDYNQQVVMSKQDLMEFTKKFAIQKVQYQEVIEKIKNQLQNQRKINFNLKQSNDQLSQDRKKLEDYMLQLRQKHQKQILQIRQSALNIHAYKDKQINSLNNKISELENNLKYQKQQNSRYLQFVKIKQDIIKNLQWQIKLKESKLNVISGSFVSNKNVALGGLNSVKSSVQDLNNSSKNFNENYQEKANRSGSKTKDIKNQIMNSGKKQKCESSCSSSKSIRITNQTNKNKLFETQKITIAKNRNPKNQAQKEKLYKLSKENKELKARNQILEVDLQLLKKQLKSKKNKHQNSDISQSLVIKQLQNQIELKNSRIFQLSGQISHLKQNNRNINSLNYTNVNNTKNNKEQQMTILKDKCFSLQQQLQKTNSKLIQSEIQLQYFRYLKKKYKQITSKEDQEKEINSQVKSYKKYEISQFDTYTPQKEIQEEIFIMPSIQRINYHQRSK